MVGIGGLIIGLIRRPIGRERTPGGTVRDTVQDTVRDGTL